MTKSLFLLLSVWAFLQRPSAAVPDNPVLLEEYPKGLLLGTFISPGGDDGFISAGAQAALHKKAGLSLSGAFHFRPFSKNRLFQTGPYEYYIYRENRYIFTAGLNEILRLYGSTAWETDLSGGYSFGSFNGSEKAAESGNAWFAATGPSILAYDGEKVGVRIRIGYEYLRLPTHSEHCFFVFFPILFKAGP